jgi:hypothetical protein
MQQGRIITLGGANLIEAEDGDKEMEFAVADRFVEGHKKRERESQQRCQMKKK